MKKILYLHAGAEMYGADKVLLELLNGLDKTEFEPHVILPNDGVLVKSLQEKGINVAVLDYPILRRKYFNLKGIFQYIKAYRKMSKELANYVREHNIDLIHNNTTAVLEGIYLKQFLKIPLIWHVHEIIVKPKIISELINFFMGIFADQIVTVSNAVAEHIKTSRFIKTIKVKTIYNGVDSETYYPYPQELKKENRMKYGFQEDHIIVGMIGRVNAWKGQGDFLAATTPLLAKYPKLQLVLVGGVFEGEEWRLETLQETIKSSGYEKQILLKDFQKETVDLYNLFDIFVLPSTNPDPLPTVVLEAMACAKPIVAYKHGGVLEMVEENANGLFAAVCQPSDLSEKIEQLVINSEQREHFSNVSRERLEKMFSMEAYIHHFESLYRKW